RARGRAASRSRGAGCAATGAGAAATAARRARRPADPGAETARFQRSLYACDINRGGQTRNAVIGHSNTPPWGGGRGGLSGAKHPIKGERGGGGGPYPRVLSPPCE